MTRAGQRPSRDPAWRRFGSGSGSTLRLYCFPYAGGSAALFQNWPRWLPAGVEVWAFEPPGHGTRLRERPLRELHALVTAVLPSLASEEAQPFALFGHSLGALVAFEVARALLSRGAPAPRALVVSGAAAPSLRGRDTVARPLYLLDQRELLDELEAMGGTPPPVLAEPELLSHVLPPLRADLEMFETYRYRVGTALAAPIIAFHGASDPLVPWEEIAGWERESRAALRCHRLAGDHFFLQDPRSGFGAALAQELRTLLSGTVSYASRGASPGPTAVSRSE